MTSEIKGLSEERLSEIMNALEEKGVSKPCPRCESVHFQVSEGYAIARFTGDGGEELQGSTPVVFVICGNCGFKFEHSLSVLGL